MDNLFTLNPTAEILDIKDGIDERINKAKGILNCLMFAIEHITSNKELNNNSTYHALWAVDGFIDEINCLEKKIYNIAKVDY